MCNCADLRYAKRNHAHAVYATNTDVAALETVHNQDVAALQAQIDAQASQHATDVAGLQGQIDALEQALIDCGCVSAPCVDWTEEFDTGIDSLSLASGDWTLSWTGTKAKVERVGAASALEAVVFLSVEETYRDGMTLTYDFDSWSLISQIQVDMLVFTQGSPVYKAIKTNIPPDDEGINLDLATIANIAEGDYITGIRFTIAATTSDPQDHPIVYIDYVRILCPV